MVSTDGFASLRRGRRVTLAVVGVALAGLVARLAFLGERIAHWDEARVAYWILNYADSGTFEYQPIIHGPFLQQVNRPLFGLLGPNDFTMRLVVALLGAALPLCALLFRERLRDAETVALALFLAADPILLYYSRFMRSDLPLAAFMLVALGFFVRALDTRQPWYAHLGVVSVALAMTTKENVLIYLVTWLGALVLLADHRLFLDRGLNAGWRTRLEGYARRAGPTLRSWTPQLLLGIFEFFAVVVFFYAPRTVKGKGGLNTVLSDPTAFPGAVEEATVGSWTEFHALWVNGGHQDHAYLPYLAHYVETLVVGSGALVALAFVGFLVDRYAGERPRDLVAFCFYWGFVSILGYPIITDIQAPWATIHAVVPLAIPAAVGVSALYRRGRAAFASDDPNLLDAVDATVVALVFLLVIAQVGVVAAADVYLDPQSEDNELVQYAQPADDIRPTIQDMAAVSATNEGTDVLLYGEFLVANTSGTREPSCSDWFNLLPLPWYMDAKDMNVSCARNVSAFERTTDETKPPVVIGLTTDREFLAARLPGYDERTYVLRTQDTSQTNTTFFIDESRLSPQPTADGGNASAEGNG